MPKIITPPDLICPITHELMQDPVMTCDGQIYDRKSIEFWLKDHHTSPLTNEKLANKTLISASDKTAEIQKFIQTNNICTKEEFFDAIRSKNLQKLKISNFLDSWILETGTGQENEEKNTTPLHIAVQEGSAEICEFLLKEGATIEVQDFEGLTPLHWAARKSNLEITRLLLAYGANINAKTNNKRMTALYFAAMKGNIEIVKLLINTKIVTKSGHSTPLHWAAINGHYHIIELLLKTQQDINLQDEQDSTALHHAVQSSCSKAVELLLKAGANAQLKDKFGKTPLDHAIEDEKRTLIKILRHSSHSTAQNEEKNTYSSLYASLTHKDQEAQKIGSTNARTQFDNAEKYAKNSRPQEKRAHAALDYLGLQKFDDVIDIGCGDSKITQYIAEKVFPGRVVGIDLSDSMTNKAYESSAKTTNLEIIHTNAKYFKFRHKFDKATSFFCVQWLSEPELLDTFKNIYDHLKEEGKTCLLIPCLDFPHIIIKGVAFSPKWANYFKGFQEPQTFFDKSYYQKLMQTTGFEKIEIETLKFQYLLTQQEFIDYTSQWCACYRFLKNEKLRNEFINDINERLNEEKHDIDGKFIMTQETIRAIGCKVPAYLPMEIKTIPIAEETGLATSPRLW